MFAIRRAFTCIVISTAAIVVVYSKAAESRKPQAVAAMPYSDYYIDHIRDLPQVPQAKIINSRSFPPSDLDIEDVVTTEILLWEVDSNVGGFFSLSYWKSLFNNRKDYNIILHQTDPITDETQAFLLHVSDNLESSQDAYDCVCSTLTPLVDECTLLLTEELLKEIILPAPMKASELATHLVEVIESNLDAHPDWVNVLQTLVLGTVTKLIRAVRARRMATPILQSVIRTEMTAFSRNIPLTTRKRCNLYKHLTHLTRKGTHH